ncbi:TIR domain-containing protein [Alistipes putredinis]|uniref:TIR domain-containing protein n=1 Tax=Alistipes putredinis TaxID=28117 RepID=UPI003966D6AF
MQSTVAFLSHRSSHKDFVKKIVDVVKRDNCIVDEFDFYPTAKTADEIIRNLNISPIFVLLISKDALDSNWVRFEMSKAKQLYDAGEIKAFMPFIIEEDVKLEELPLWITRDWSLNVKTITSPKIIGQFIIETQRKIRCNENNAYGSLINTFIGRRNELDELQSAMYDSVYMPHRSLVVSGKPGSGRTRFIQKCIQDSSGLSFIPEGFQIKLPQKSYIDNFILQLHEGLGLSKESYEDILKLDPEHQIAKTVSYINRIINAHSFLLIEDEMSFVLYDGTISEWGKKIISHPAMIDSLKIFISSRVKPRSSELRAYPQIIHINLPSFTKEERKRLFVNYCRYYKVELSNEDVEWFVNRLQSSPQQLEHAVREIKSKNAIFTKKNIDNLIKLGDDVFSRIFSWFKGNDTALTLARVLADVDMISFDLLEQLYEEDYPEIEKLINMFASLSIVGFYGNGGNNISLDSGVADYIRRSYLDLDPIMKSRIEEIIYNKIDVDEDDFGELSIFLCGLRKQLLSGNGYAYIMPSIVISTVINLYDQGEYELVKNICLHALEHSSSYTNEPLQELYYRLCQVLARMKDSNFFTYINKIQDISSKDFLMGFYYRYKENYLKAEEYLLKALTINPNMQVARRELVNVYLNQCEYGEALPLAKENYNRKSTNPYHIEAYFRCLVNNYPWNIETKDTLKRLLKEMENIPSKRREELLVSMQLEYFIKSRSHTKEEIKNEIDEAMSLYPASPQLYRIKGEYESDKNIFCVN